MEVDEETNDLTHQKKKIYENNDEYIEDIDLIVREIKSDAIDVPNLGYFHPIFMIEKIAYSDISLNEDKLFDYMYKTLTKYEIEKTIDEWRSFKIAFFGYYSLCRKLRNEDKLYYDKKLYNTKLKRAIILISGDEYELDDMCEHNDLTAYCNNCSAFSKEYCRHHRIEKNCIICKSKKCDHMVPFHSCKLCNGKFQCSKDNCDNILFKYSHDYCYSCMDINDCITKEHIVVKKIIDKFSEFKWISNKTSIYSSSRKRPDLITELKNHFLMVEIDEKKHNSYKNTDEKDRLRQIHSDCGCIKPLVVIRFNPDNYAKDGVKHDSCYEYINGKAEIVDKKNEKRRLKKLFYYIKKYSEKDFNINPKLKVKIKKLFF